MEHLLSWQQKVQVWDFKLISSPDHFVFSVSTAQPEVALNWTKTLHNLISSMYNNLSIIWRRITLSRNRPHIDVHYRGRIHKFPKVAIFTKYGNFESQNHEMTS